MQVVLSFMCSCTSTWSPSKLYRQPSYGLNLSVDSCNLWKVDQNITYVELPWSIRTRCTFLLIVTIEITTGSLSCGTTSYKSAFVKKRSGSGDWSGFPPSSGITSLTYFFHWEAVHPPLEKAPEIVLISPWTGISCPWSPAGTAVVGVPRLSCRYSFRKPFLTSSSNLVVMPNNCAGCGQRLGGTRTKCLCWALTFCRSSVETSICLLRLGWQSAPRGAFESCVW